MSTETIGVLLFVGITVGLAVVCILLGKGLSIMTDRVLPDDK